MKLTVCITVFLLSLRLAESFGIKPRFSRAIVRVGHRNVHHTISAVKMTAGKVESEEGGGVEEVDEVLAENEEDDEVANDNAEESSLEENSSNQTDPNAVAIKELETKLQAELISIEAILKAERSSLSKIKDKVTESGKTGFFMVQAQVADFTKKRDVDQKARVERNKREFVEKMIPVVDMFRNAPVEVPATTEKEENMHKNFGSLLSGILTVFGKYGFEEFDAAIGGKVDPVKHQVAEVVEGDTDGIVLKQFKKGYMHKTEHTVVRRAVVSVSKTPKPAVEAEVVEESSSDAPEETIEEEDDEQDDDEDKAFPEEEAN